MPEQLASFMSSFWNHQSQCLISEKAFIVSSAMQELLKTCHNFGTQMNPKTKREFSLIKNFAKNL